MENHNTIPSISAETMESTKSAFNAFTKFTNARKWKDYKELLPAFAEHMGFNLIVEPDSSGRLGYANGRDIVVNEEWGMNTFYFAYFHELAHNVLHFKNGEPIERDRALIELEADLFSLMFCDLLFPEHYESFVEIARKNPVTNFAGLINNN